MAKSDPTEDVLATIARIFEQADAMKIKSPFVSKPLPERTPIVNPFARGVARPPAAEPRAPAPIARPLEAPAAVIEVPPPPVSPSAEPAPQIIEAHPAPDETAEALLIADGYSRVGPGPLEAIRFRWTARAAAESGADGYFVDETIGPASRAITSGPMSAEDALAFIDLQVQEAFERFERLKQSAAELPTHREAQAIVEQIHAEHNESEDQGF